MYKVAQENKELNIINASRFKNNDIIIKDYGLLQSILTFYFKYFAKFFGGIVTDYTVAYKFIKQILKNAFLKVMIKILL